MNRVKNSKLEENLNFLNLTLNKLPKFINDSIVPNFSPSRLNNDKDLKVYKFVPINKIEILLTPCLRSDDLKKKYAKALSIKAFLNYKGDEEERMLYKNFARIVKNANIDELKKVEKMQKSFDGKVPFKVKYNRDHLWQIYYSASDDKYFMLVCTKEESFSEFLYLLKAKIDFEKAKTKEVPKIYVPINHMGYNEEILEKSEITDIENYLWLFTKSWPLVFEVYDDNNELTLQVIGETFVYKNVKSNYKVILKKNEEAMKFYKLLKALFILQTEIKGHYEFETRVNSSNGLSMYLSKVEITFDSLTNFIKNEFLLANYEIKEQNKNNAELEKELADLNKKVAEKEEEYLLKQKEISTYLECKKSFIGKVKYFFRSEKEKMKKIRESSENVSESEDIQVDTAPIETYTEDKAFYTIEDLVTIYTLHDKSKKIEKSLKQDIKALELKLENLVSKVKNANQYIEEIDKHKKSIFEFWKFANKDEKLALEMAGNEEEETNSEGIKKIFDLEMDFEKLGEQVDSIQRKKLSNEELDSIFMVQTELLNIINMVYSKEIVKSDLEEQLEKLKQEFNEKRLVISSETFDIFGNIDENDKKVQYIGSKVHREQERDKYKIMNINKKIDIFDFTEKMQSIVNYLEGAIPKITSLYDMPLYKLVHISKNITQGEFGVFDINVENEFRQFEDDDEGAYNLICLNYKEGIPLIYYSNIMFFDNTNKTLPLGMDLSTKVLVDGKKLEFSLVNKTKFRTNLYFKSNSSGEPKSKDIFVYEYNVNLKDEKNKITETESELTEMVDDNAFEENDALSEMDNLEDMIENDEYNETFDEPHEMNYEDTEENKEDIQEENTEETEIEEEEPVVKKSKKLLKIEQKYEKEMEKQQKKEEKARRKLEKKNKNKEGKRSK